MRKNIPNFITLLNLTAGVAGIIFILNGKIEAAIYMVFLAGVLDFLDGLAARVLNAYSDMGKSLDSLADIVSFGVLPGIIIYLVLVNNPFPGFLGDVVPFVSVFIPAFAAVRLAIFNNDPDQKSSFRGLPTPANAFMVVSAAWYYSEIIPPELIHTSLLLIIVIAGCNLMVSGLRMFALKFGSGEKPFPVVSIIFLALSVLLILIFGIEGIFLVIVLYILLSLLNKG